MSYGSILIIFEDEVGFHAKLNAAMSLARRHDAHLDVLCAARFLAPRSGDGADAGGAAFVAAIQYAANRSAALAARARGRLERQGIRWAVKDAGAQFMNVGDCIAPHARYADLVILPGKLSRDGGLHADAVTEAALFAGHAPVLMVPPAGLPDGPTESVVIAWDGGDGAMAAVRAALPLLVGARKVSVAVVDPQWRDLDLQAPGTALARYLVRQGVRAEVVVLTQTTATVSETLGQHLRERGAELLVMGAYGHARLREWILGGTTRDMLRDAAVPVLLAS